jgi:hypothetical protein
MEDIGKDKLYILQGNRKWYELALGGILYSIQVFFICKMLYNSILYQSTKLFFLELILNLKIFGLIMPIALSLTIVKDIFIDLTKDKLETIYSVGVFKYRRYSKIPELNYISVFKNPKEEFEVNLWYVKNKHYTMYTYEDYEGAMLFGRTISDKLNIDLLDATEKGNFKWIEKE